MNSILMSHAAKDDQVLVLFRVYMHEGEIQIQIGFKYKQVS